MKTSKKLTFIVVPLVVLVMGLIAYMKPKDNGINDDKSTAAKATQIKSQNPQKVVNISPIDSQQSQKKSDAVNNVSLNANEVIDTSINPQIQPIAADKDPSNTVRY